MTLARFHDAQSATIAVALAELRAGRKRSHWMWFVFPQLVGLGRSPTARHFAIRDLAEARAYLADPQLARHLAEASDAVLIHRDRPIAEILGEEDALKLRSSATLFDRAGGGAVFGEVLAAFHDGVPCARTIALLRGDT